MNRRIGASMFVLGVTMSLAASLAASGASAHPRHHKPAQKPDPRDARIEALEAEVNGLVAEMRQIRVEQVRVEQAAVAAKPAPAAPVFAAGAPPTTPPSPVAGAQVVAGVTANAPVSSPDTPRPVTTAAAGAPTGGASIVAGRPSIASADGRFVANLHGVMQFDAAKYFQSATHAANVDLRRGAAATDTAHARDLNDGTDFRRARIGIDGKAFGDFEYNVLFDFGGSGAEDAGHIQELWVQYSGFKPFHLKIGAFPPSIGLEDQGSTNGMPFLERPAITDVARGLSAGDFREGAQLWAAGDRWFASGAVTTRVVGVVNSQATGTAQTYDQALGFVGRLAYIPFKGDDWLTHVGVHGSYAAQIADTGGPDTAAGTARYPVNFQERPELRVDGTRLVATGGINASHAGAVGAEIAAQNQNVFIQAEFESLDIERRHSLLSDPSFSGYYVEGSWILTGERRRYNPNTFAFDAPPVDHPFDLTHGAWGAWELALRYSDLDLNYHAGSAGLAVPTDGVRGGDQQIFTAGLNWYLNPIVRFMLDYQHVDISRLSPSATTFATPVGAQIGQRYDTLSIRSQLAF